MRKFMQRRSTGVALLLVLPVIGVLGEPRLSTGQVQWYPVFQRVECGPVTSCVVPGVTCYPAPTSLRPIAGGGVGEWESAGGNCGARRRWFFWWVACGPPLSSGVCPDAAVPVKEEGRFR